MTIKPGYSSDFDYYRDVYSEIANLLNQEAVAFCQDNDYNSPDQNYLLTLFKNCSITCVYFPHLGFLINIKDTNDSGNSITENSLEIITNTLNLEIVFISLTSGVYCKSLRMIHLDEVYGDIHSKIKDIEIDICHNFVSTFFPFETRQKFIQLCNAIFHLDAILSLSYSIDKFMLTRPILSEHNNLNIKDGRFLFFLKCLVEI